MGKVYRGQTALRITLITNVDVTGYQSAIIKYTKPDGTTSGSWTSFVDNLVIGSVYHDFSSALELDQEGNWTIWAYVTFSDGRTAAGEPVKFFVYNEGE
jgi:hypothetical protein